ncbi:hypothetical protein Gpo141_00006176 [Globisporangium polare]
MDGDNRSSETATARMLVVGADPTAKRDVLAKLHALCGQKASAAGVQQLTLATKYYTADVDVHLHQVLENEPVTALAHDPADYEAAVCVMDVAREESFLHVSRFLAQLSDAQIEVCLLVGVNSQSEKTSAVAQHIERVQVWCLDNEFEFVELCDDAADSAAPAESDNQLENGFEANEKQGMDRVLEALHCNMWSSIVMRSSEAQAIDDNGLRELSNVSVALSSPSPVDGSSDEKKKLPVALSSNQTDAQEDEDAGEEDDGRLQTLLRALEITEAADKESASPDKNNGNKTTSSSNQDDDDDDDDIDMAEFSTLISEVRRVRDSGQALTDEQRRQRAAEVAMKLWSFLGEDDESDAEEEEGAKA